MLKLEYLSKTGFKKATLLFLFFILVAVNCGKRKPPLPPIEKVIQRVEISGTQRGNIVYLSWNLPSQNAPDGNPLNINRIDIYRLTENPTTPLVLTEEEFASRSILISSLPVTVEDFQRKQIIYKDTLEFAGQNSRIRYAIRFVNASGQKAAFSNFLLIEPTTQIAGSPTSLSYEVKEDAIQIKWDVPKENVDGSKPANVLGFNIYRGDKANETPNIINRSPVQDSFFDDKSFEFGKNYQYFVRTISLGNDGEPIESLDSNVIEVKPIDTFPPSPPTALTIAAAPNNLSIFFVKNSEKDLKGYRIYRTINREIPLINWQLLTKEILTTNTYQDKNVTSGLTYFYFITAEDNAGNVSQPSEIVSETAP